MLNRINLKDYSLAILIKKNWLLIIIKSFLTLCHVSRSLFLKRFYYHTRPVIINSSNTLLSKTVLALCIFTFFSIYFYPDATHCLADTEGRQVLTVSASSDHFPYSYIDDSGQVVGYAVDLLDAVAEVMKVDLKRTVVPPKQDIENLTNGTYDIAQFHAPVPDHDNPAEFSQPVLVNYGDIFIRKGDDRFHNLDDLRKKQIIIAGPNQSIEHLIEKGFDASQLREGSSPDCLKWLKNGEVDAVLVTRLTGVSQAFHLGIDNIEPIGSDLNDLKVTYCIATRKGDTKLIGRINEALATLSVTGKTVEIYSKWFGRYEAKGLSSLHIMLIVTGSLLLALVVALWGLYRQRQLRQRIALQASELKTSEDILAEAQHFAHLGHWRYGLIDGEKTLWSAETYRIFERFKFQDPPDMEKLIDYAVPEDRDRWQKALEDSHKKGINNEVDILIEPKPGLQKYIHFRSRPVLNDEGECIALFGTVQNVTAAREAEAALRQSEQLLSAIYTNLPLGLVALETRDKGRVVIAINPSAVNLFSLESSPKPECYLNDCGLSDEWNSKLNELLDKSMDSISSLNEEISLNDLQHTYTINIIRLESVDGKHRCLLLIDDVTNKKRQDMEISQGRRLQAIGQLAGGIAHEFNNLLTPILANSEMLMNAWSHNQELKNELEKIVNAAKRSADLTRRLLSFGRKSERKPEKINLIEVIDANVQLIQQTIDRRITINTSLPNEIPLLFLFPDDLHQIILNLLVNARDTLDEKLKEQGVKEWVPAINIEANLLSPEHVSPVDSGKLPARVMNWVRLTIDDNGSGISPKVVDRIFEPFYTTKEVGQGTGLGLATAWHLVVEFGGRISVDSIPGKGTAFHVFIPVFSADVDEESSIEEQEELPEKSEHMHFLLAEDEEIVADIADKILQLHEHKVTTAIDGNEAWMMLSSGQDIYDAILMDLNMPGIHGIELARRAREAGFKGPIVVMSGNVSGEELKTLEGLGINNIIHKPFTVKSFEDAILKAIK